MSEAETQRVLGVFAKEPVAGRVKTRLAEDSSPTFAARVAEAMLRDTLHRLRRVEARCVLAFSPPRARALFEDWAAEAYELTVQPQGDLGIRMSHFFAEHLLDADTAVLVGSDSPTLPTEYVEQAFAALEKVDVVLGPATDGGFYLIGLRNVIPDGMFLEVEWGGHTVLGQTVERLPAECSLALLPPWYDVDTMADLAVAKNHYHALLRAGETIELPHLCALLGW
jgi:rSAM/selenodomain-associated transferase 1